MVRNLREKKANILGDRESLSRGDAEASHIGGPNLNIFSSFRSESVESVESKTEKDYKSAV